MKHPALFYSKYKREREQKSVVCFSLLGYSNCVRPNLCLSVDYRFQHFMGTNDSKIIFRNNGILSFCIHSESIIIPKSG